MRTGPKIWVPSGTVVNPSDQQVLADSGVLPFAGAWLLAVVGQCDTSFRYKLVAPTVLNQTIVERRPAAGDVDLLVPNHVPIPQGERIQVVMIGNLTGSLHLTLHGVLVE